MPSLVQLQQSYTPKPNITSAKSVEAIQVLRSMGGFTEIIDSKINQVIARYESNPRFKEHDW